MQARSKKLGGPAPFPPHVDLSCDQRLQQKYSSVPPNGSARFNLWRRSAGALKVSELLHAEAHEDAKAQLHNAN